MGLIKADIGLFKGAYGVIISSIVSFLDFCFPQSTHPRDANRVGIAVVHNAPGDLKIPALLDLVEDRIARLDFAVNTARCQRY